MAATPRRGPTLEDTFEIRDYRPSALTKQDRKARKSEEVAEADVEVDGVHIEGDCLK